MTDWLLIGLVAQTVLLALTASLCGFVWLTRDTD